MYKLHQNNVQVWTKFLLLYKQIVDLDNKERHNCIYQYLSEQSLLVVPSSETHSTRACLVVWHHSPIFQLILPTPFVNGSFHSQLLLQAESNGLVCNFVADQVADKSLQSSGKKQNKTTTRARYNTVLNFQKWD